MNWRMIGMARTAKVADAAWRAGKARPVPDALKVMESKRRKLATRDELALLEAGLLSRN